MTAYDEIVRRNVEAYDGAVAERAAGEAYLQPWKLTEHESFEQRLADAGHRTIIEIGAGTGVHSRRFADAGYDVLATDPSPAMIAHCAARGLQTQQTDVIGLRLDEPRDAAFAMNSLLHVPRALLGTALGTIRRALVPGGLCYVGIYGGEAREGVVDEDGYEPKRWFASHSDEEMVAAAWSVYGLVDFHVVDLGVADLHFQSLTLQRPR